jgi:hypothetical protein
LGLGALTALPRDEWAEVNKKTISFSISKFLNNLHSICVLVVEVATFFYQLVVSDLVLQVEEHHQCV